MDLEKLIHRMAKDAAFAKSVREDAKTIINKEGYRLSDEELEALQSILEKANTIDRVQIGDKPMYDWYEAQLYDWYVGQLRYQQT
jgi:hypothetical protein